MRVLSLITLAVVTLTGLAAGPSVAGNFSSIAKYRSPAMLAHVLCVPPQQLENVCIAWAPGAPGTFAGPCIQYQLRCVSPTVLH